MNKEYERNTVRHGVGIGHGCCGGRLLFFRRTQRDVKKTGKWDARTELSRVRAAVEKSVAGLRALCERARIAAGDEEAEIFEIHAMLASDEDFLDAIDREIESGAFAEEAIGRAAKEYSACISSLGDVYLASRAEDIKDVARRLLDALYEEEEAPCRQEEEPFLLVADELSPAETVTLDKNKVLGFVLFGGTPNSHASILARAMGIPALIGVGEIADSFEGTYALLDAAEGSLTLLPDESRLKSFQEKERALKHAELAREQQLSEVRNRPAVTRSGKKLLIYANVGDDGEVDAAFSNGADGIGLLRSEILYLSKNRYPTEEELFESYRATVSRMRGKLVVVRTLDMGADKQAPYLGIAKEENPALGFRGIRISLADKTQFKVQLRSILRASAFGRLAVMLPMVIGAEEVKLTRRLLEECMGELEERGIAFDRDIELGIMIETPAAAIMSDELARVADFFSVGTNDLCQYTLAADRQNATVADLVNENREPILRLIAHAAKTIHAAGGWIGICGEMAADVTLTQRFADMGIDELSVSVPYLFEIRKAVTECN